MKKSRAVLFFLSLCVARTTFAGGTSEGMEFVDLRGIDRSLLQKRAGVSQIEPLGPRVHAASVRAGDSRFLPTSSGLRIDPNILLLHKRSAEADSPRTQITLRLPLDTRAVDLSVVDYVYDPSFSAFHVAAAILNESAGYARFTVSGDGRFVVGTVHSDFGTYRIRSDSGAQFQLLIPVMSDTDGEFGVFDSSGPVGKLESRHVQMAKIAEMQPRYFNTDEDGNLGSIFEAAIGTIDFPAAVTINSGSPIVDYDVLKRELEGLFDQIRALTQMNERLTFEIDSVTGVEGPISTVKFHQILGGIPVGTTNYIMLDPESGAVLTYVGTLFSTQAAEQVAGTRLDSNSGLQFALDALARDVGVAGDAAVRTARLEHYPNAQGELRPTWLVVFDIGGGTFGFRVDALTGAAERLITEHEFKHTVCESTSGAASCEHPKYVENSSGNRVCMEAPCNAREATAWDTVKEVENRWQSYGGSANCCTNLPNGSGYVDQMQVVLGVSGGPAASGPNHIVKLPPVGTYGYITNVDPVGAETDDAFLHEVMHIYQYSYNYSADSSPYQLPRTISEGLADVNSALGNDAISTGDWVVGDGRNHAGERQTTRDLSLEKHLSDFDPDIGADPHANGMIVGHMYYMLSQEPGVDLPGDLYKVMLGSWRLLSPASTGGQSTYEWEDYKAAMLASASGDGQLQTAINNVWAVIAGSGGGGGGSGGGGSPPGAPGTIAGIFQYCDPYLYGSIYMDQWSVSSGASFYLLYYSTNFGSGPWWYLLTTGSTYAWTEEWQDTWTKVRACNANGCSPLSAATAYEPHICW